MRTTKVVAVVFGFVVMSVASGQQPVKSVTCRTSHHAPT